jgi:hypothetical protein
VRQRAREELVLVSQRFATGFTLPVLLFTFRDATLIVSATTCATLLFPYTALQTRISAFLFYNHTFIRHSCHRTGIGERNNGKQEKKPEKLESETHRNNLSVKLRYERSQVEYL